MKTEISAEVSANVWKVLVKTGQDVSEGDTLVILECMKMEVPVEASAAGKIASLSVAEGDAIEEGSLIAVIES
tara:strand:+ start:91 stop:309 length:219 start_codon:yes stop_codon:yes gene_type:complete